MQHFGMSDRSSDEDDSAQLSDDGWSGDEGEEDDDTEDLTDSALANLPIFERLERQEAINAKNAKSSQGPRQLKKAGMDVLHDWNSVMKIQNIIHLQVARRRNTRMHRQKCHLINPSEG